MPCFGFVSALYSKPPEVQTGSPTSGNHGDDLQPQTRERTNSDPLRQRNRQHLPRMGSEPTGSSSQTSGHSQDPLGASGTHDSRSYDQSAGHQRSKVPETPQTDSADDVDIVESGDFVVASLVSRGADDKHDIESVSSRGSVLQPSGANLLYTDSEDNRSISNRSGTLGDSGYIG